MFKLVDTFYVDTESESRAFIKVIQRLFVEEHAEKLAKYCSVITKPQGNTYSLLNQMFIVKFDPVALQYCVQYCKKV